MNSIPQEQMRSDMDKAGIVDRYGIFAVAGSSVAFFLGTGLRPLWPFIWVALVPILLLATRKTGRSAVPAAFLAWILGELNMLGYLMPILPLPILVFFLILPALVFAASVAGFRWAWVRHKRLLAVLCVPSVWCTHELLLLRLSPHGSFGSLAYTQVQALPVIQLAAVTGVTGISFLILITSAATAAAISQRSLRSAPVILAAACLASALIFGITRLLGSPSSGGRIVVCAAAVDSTLRYFGSPRLADSEAAVNSYAEVVAGASASGAQLIVIPEKFVTTTAETSSQIEIRLSELARSNGVMLVAGINVLGSPMRNLALTFSASGSLVGRYEKARLVPGIEAGYAHGSTPGLLSIGEKLFGVAICKDMDFPQDLRLYSAKGATLLAVPAWDFGEDGPMHARMAVVRGIEGGYSVVRAAQRGLVTISDPFGRTVAHRSGMEEPALVTAAVPARARSTPYTRVGDLFGIIALIFTIVFCSAVLTHRRHYNP